VAVAIAVAVATAVAVGCAGVVSEDCRPSPQWTRRKAAAQAVRRRSGVRFTIEAYSRIRPRLRSALNTASRPCGRG
jgi:hypothetical protein